MEGIIPSGGTAVDVDGQKKVNIGTLAVQELFCGFTAALIASPVSHVPSVIAAYQQGHNLPLRIAYSNIIAEGGWRELWRGLGARTLSLAGTMTVVPIVISALA